MINLNERLRKMSFDRGVQVLVMLNIVDAISTHLLLRLGVATEINPLLSWAYSQSPSIFWVVKFGLLSISLILLGAVADDSLSRWVLMASNILYAIVTIIHVSGWAFYFV